MKLPAHSSGRARLEHCWPHAPCLQTVLRSRAEPRLLWGPPSSKSNGSNGLWSSKVPARWVSEDDCCGFGLAKASWDLSRGHQPWPVIPSALPLSYFPRPKCHGGWGWTLSVLYRKMSLLCYCNTDYWVSHLKGRSWHWKGAVEEEEDCGHCSELFGNALKQLINKELP